MFQQYINLIKKVDKKDLEGVSYKLLVQMCNSKM